MKNKQKPILKFLISLCLFVFCLSSSSAQVSFHRLRVADSLFAAKKYTQSFEIYETICKNNEYTPAMLLRMALIQEGLGNIGKALYYLNLYYEASRDVSATRKMEELATKYELRGYEASDESRLVGWYHEHHFLIACALGAAGVFLLVLAFYIQRNFKQNPIGSVITLTALLIVLGVHVNLGDGLELGIVASPKTYLMSGPSSGADVIEILSEGHRIEVIGRDDVWLKIRWQGSTAYVKDTGVQSLTLSAKSEL